MRTSVAAAALGPVLFVCACASPREEQEAPPDAEAPADATAPGAPGGPAEDVGEDAPRAAQDGADLDDERRSSLVANHIERARQFAEEEDWQRAEEELVMALELDPGSEQARDLLGDVRAASAPVPQPEELAAPGEPGEQVAQEGQQGQEEQTATTADLLQERYELRRAQAEAEARDNLQQARRLLERGEQDRAIFELELALDVVTRPAYAGEWDELEEEIRELLETARADRDQAIAARQEQEQRRVREELRRAEEQERARRHEVVSQLLDSAIRAFNAQEYDRAMEIAERVLRVDPRNERAQDIRDTAFRQQRELLNAQFLRRKREQYARWQQEMEELRIPYQGVLTLPDEDFWNDITELRKDRSGLELAEEMTPGEQELRRRLQETRIPGLQVDQEESLAAVAGAIRTITGLPIVVDPLAEEAAFDEGVVFDFSLTSPLTVAEALNLVTEMAGPEVTWTVRHDTVLITTNEKARGNVVIVNHDVQDLIFGLTDFLGPRIDRLRLIDELEDDEDISGGAFGRIGERPTITDPDDLVSLVQDNVAVDSWDQEGVSITSEAGNMVVVQTPAVQREVRRFLEELRRFSSSLVTIESKFLVIRQGFLQEIGVDFRGLDNPGTPFTDLDDLNFGSNPTEGLDNLGDAVTQSPPSAGAFFDEGADGDLKARTENFFTDALGEALTSVGGATFQYTFLNDLQLSAILRMVEKSQNVELINDQILSVHNTQRAYVTVVNQRAYVQDFDVEVAQFQAIADPVINVLTEGIVLDVRPTIDHTRQYLTLEIQPTVAQVVSLTDFSTTLAGQTQAVTFQLPELEVQSVFTTVNIPDGGSILIGGLSRLRNIERRAEVPWLANIPLVGFFFKEQGYDDERESLMILIKAWISDVREELARLERGGGGAPVRRTAPPN